MSSSPAWDVRLATTDDAPAVAAINVASWKRAYRDLLPAAYLDGLSAGAERIELWAHRLAQPGDGVRCWVAERDGRVAAYAIAGPYRDGDFEPSSHGELYALYADPEAWGAGAGPAAYAAVRASFTEDGYRAALLWMLKGNRRAGRFYEREGWSLDGGHKREPFTADGSVVAEEVRYRLLLPPSA